jgi:aromatic ring-opening dioxygenase catalytic subunit (LigB family)
MPVLYYAPWIPENHRQPQAAASWGRSLPPSLRMSCRWTAAVSQISAHYVSNAIRAGNVLRLGFATAALR